MSGYIHKYIYITFLPETCIIFQLDSSTIFGFAGFPHFQKFHTSGNMVITLGPRDYDLSAIDLKPLLQIFSTESKVNFPCGNNFLYQFFGNYNLKMKKID